MKVHELIDEYKKISEDMKKDHAEALKSHNRYIAYLQSLDPSARISPNMWDGFSDWKAKQDTKHHAI